MSPPPPCWPSPLPEEVAAGLDRVLSELWKSPQAISLPPSRSISQDLGCYPFSGLGRGSGSGGLLGGDGRGMPLSPAGPLPQAVFPLPVSTWDQQPRVIEAAAPRGGAPPSCPLLALP